MSSSVKQRVYYNVSINNTDLLPKIGEFNDYRQTPIINNPKDYTISLLKMKVPSTFIPIQYFPVQYDDSNPDNLNKSIYSITLEYQNQIFKKNLEWIPQQIPPYIRNPPPPPIIPTNKKSDVLSLLYYSLYSYTHFCNILNKALKDVFMADIVPLLPVREEPYTAPFFVYSHTIRRFNYFVDSIFLYDNDNPSRVKMWFNGPLNTNFGSSFDVHYRSFESNDGRDVLYVPTDLNFKIIKIGLIDAQVYEQSQEYNTDNLFSDFKSIIVRSDSMQINKEDISLGDNLNNSTSISALGNYFIDVNLDLSNARENIYIDNTRGEFQRINLRSSIPISNVQISLLWRDRYDNIFPILIGNGQNAFIKFMFEEK